MLALSLIPLRAGSASLQTIPEPPLDEGAVLARTLAVGVCRTDREILAGEYGLTPLGRTHLVLGHESLAEVQDAPSDSGLARRDLIVASCAIRTLNRALRARPANGTCSSTDSTQGLASRKRDGFCRERWRPRKVLITGAGPVGLLAALMTQQRGCELHAYDRHLGCARTADMLLDPLRIATISV